MKRKLQGSVTVEMTFLFPVILMVFVSCVMTTFYLHDKNILAGAAYETAVVGGTKMRERDGVTEEDLVSLCEERIGKKCILFGSASVSVDISKEEIEVEVKARNEGFGVSVVKKAAVTEPEEKIREAARLKKGVEIAAEGIREFAGGKEDVNGSEGNIDGENHYD